MSNLLNTQTIDYLGLIGNGRSYKVPDFQRDYSWDEEQWEDLWRDLEELRPNPNAKHYMGAIVVVQETDRDFRIIDGQQRIATLTILALAVIKLLVDLAEATPNPEHRERADRLRSRFIGERDPASLVEVSKLALNKHDNDFFQEYPVQLREHPNLRSLPRSNRLIANCFSYFMKKLRSDEELAANGTKLAEMVSEVAARRLHFILITVDDEMSAYTVFETLNARGLALTTTDLLKNYLFSRVKTRSDQESVQRKWDRLIELTGQERFSEFLRYHYLTENPQIRTGRLFKLVRDKVRDAQAVFALLESLDPRAELFSALGDPANPFWIDRSSLRDYVRELSLFGVKQMTPLLFAAFERLPPIEIEKVLKLIVTISFRYTVISGRNTNELEPTYHAASSSVLKGESQTAADVFEHLRRIYVSDEEFVSAFADKELALSSRKKIVKYVLSKLESYSTGRQVDFESDPGTIEHILPQNFDDSWVEAFGVLKPENYIERLGNLTLLEASRNRDGANQPYEKKLLLYRESAYTITQQIAETDPDTWNVSKLERRQRQMAQDAKVIWKSDFA